MIQGHLIVFFFLYRNNYLKYYTLWTNSNTKSERTQSGITDLQVANEKLLENMYVKKKIKFVEETKIWTN